MRREFGTGLCLEKISPQSPSKLAVISWIDQIKQCYETASDLGLLYLQQQDKLHTMSVTSTLGGKTIEFTLRLTTKLTAYNLQVVRTRRNQQYIHKLN